MGEKTAWDDLRPGDRRAIGWVFVFGLLLGLIVGVLIGALLVSGGQA